MCVVSLGERMAATASGDEKVVGGRRWCHRSLERLGPGVGDGPRREAFVCVGRVRIVGVMLDGGCGLADERRARRGLLGKCKTPIARGWVTLEMLGVEG